MIESMKMEHSVDAPEAGAVAKVPRRRPATSSRSGDLLAVLEAGQAGPRPSPERAEGPSTAAGERADLAAVRARHAVGLDEARPDAVERRRATGQRTARENVADLLDPGSLVEYGPLAIAAQRRRRALDDLIARTPADGLVAGVGTVAGHPTVVMSYDYTVLAGTQGLQNHRKKDRLFEVAERQRLPLVFFTEGGGGRPGDTDGTGVSGLDCLAFNLFGRLSGLVPLVGIASGRCFAGNAAILGCCDVIIATEDSNIGMGGPAMVEGGGLGMFPPEAIGPMSVQVPNGVVDVAVPDEAAAVAVAKQYLSYFQGPAERWLAPPEDSLREVVPENRLRVYDVRAAIDGPRRRRVGARAARRVRAGDGDGAHPRRGPADGGRRQQPAAPGRGHRRRRGRQGRPLPAAVRRLRPAGRLPLRHAGDHGRPRGRDHRPGPPREPAVRDRAPTSPCPFGTIILRKGYGLGAQAMAGGSFKAPLFCVAWPTGEVGGMGLEGAVQLGYRKELEAIEDPAERERTFAEMVDRMYEHGQAVNAASHFEIDDVIDPADSRRWISTTFAAVPAAHPAQGKKRPNIDTW